jgi:uncharacterized membrane protein
MTDAAAQELFMTKGATTIAIITGALGAIIVGLSLYYFFSISPLCGDKEKAALANDLFGMVVTKTLVPIFNTLIAAVLAWVFGKPLFEALAERIKTAPRTSDTRN